MSTNWWGMKNSEGNNNLLVVNNNDLSAKQKDDLLDALRLSQNNCDVD